MSFLISIKFKYGVEGDRTPDLCNAIAALSQLSYDPESQLQIINYELRMSKSLINVRITNYRKTFVIRN